MGTMLYSNRDPELRTAAELLMKSLADAGIKIDPTQGTLPLPPLFPPFPIPFPN